MKKRDLFGIVCGSVALAACGGGGGGDGVLNPAFVGQTLTAVSATLSGTSNGQVFVGFDANNNLIIQTPDGEVATLLPNSGTSVIDSGLGNRQVIIVRSVQGDDIEIVRDGDIGLVRIDDFDSPLPGFEVYAAFGDETASLPTGSATYNGRFVSSSFVGGNVPNAEDSADGGFDDIYGSASIEANFTANSVNVALTFDANNPADFAGGSLSGTNLGISGSQYSGSISGSTASYDLQGSLIGAFYGLNAGQTAGTFTAEDLGDNAEIVGGYIADKTSP